MALQATAQPAAGLTGTTLSSNAPAPAGCAGSMIGSAWRSGAAPQVALTNPWTYYAKIAAVCFTVSAAQQQGDPCLILCPSSLQHAASLWLFCQCRAAQRRGSLADGLFGCPLPWRPAAGGRHGAVYDQNRLLRKVRQHGRCALAFCPCALPSLPAACRCCMHAAPAEPTPAAALQPHGSAECTSTVCALIKVFATPRRVTQLEAQRLEETREEREQFLAQVRASSGCGNIPGVATTT